LGVTRNGAAQRAPRSVAACPDQRIRRCAGTGTIAGVLSWRGLALRWPRPPHRPIRGCAALFTRRTPNLPFDAGNDAVFARKVTRPFGNAGRHASFKSTSRQSGPCGPAACRSRPRRHALPRRGRLHSRLAARPPRVKLAQVIPSRWRLSGRARARTPRGKPDYPAVLSRSNVVQCTCRRAGS
jgi:hypothetical protein